MSAPTKPRRSATDRYLELVQQFPLRPLHTKADHQRALALVDQFAVVKEGSLSPGEQDYFETLVLLVDDYESRNDPVDTSHVDPIEVLKHLMEEHGMNTTDLGKLFGSKGIASEVLNGKRELSKSHIAALAERFAVGAGVFFSLPSKKSRVA
jgi:HTH-type transcriptional regulator/antitoxin HigA